MRNFILLSLFVLISSSSFADTGALESMAVSTSQVGVNFEDNDKSIVLTFSEHLDESVHTVIDIERINDLEYKTRVMRYFGGLLKTETFNFKNLIIVIDGERLKFNWSRENVSSIVKVMLRQAELMA